MATWSASRLNMPARPATCGNFSTREYQRECPRKIKRPEGCEPSGRCFTVYRFNVLYFMRCGVKSFPIFSCIIVSVPQNLFCDLRAQSELCGTSVSMCDTSPDAGLDLCRIFLASLFRNRTSCRCTSSQRSRLRRR